MKQDITPFLRGGLPGIVRLKQVLASIIAYHMLEHGMEQEIIQKQMEVLLQQAGFKTYMDSKDNLSFHIPESLCDPTDATSLISVE